MAKDTPEVEEEVEQVEQAELGGERQEEAPKDIRGAIKAAIKETEEKEAVEDEKPEKKEKEEIDKTDDPDKSSTKQKVSGQRDRDSEIKEEKEEKEEKKEDKTEPPPYYKNKGKAVWDKLSPEDKQLILAREAEVSDGFKKTSEKVRAFEDMERVIAPRLPAIQRFGATPAQTIDRLFQWMEALSNPNESVRVNSLKQLAANSGINLAQLVSKAAGIEEAPDPTETVDQSQPPAWASQIVGKVTTLEEQLASQRQASADSVVANWAKDKPHYPKVNQLMYQLMISGAVPMKDGNLDLDGAYEAACKLNSEVSTLIQQEKEAKDKEEADKKAKQEAQLAKARLEKARKAGSGLKPAAPSIASSQPKAKANGAGRNTESVRDSLRRSLNELNEA